ncbi:MAG: RluA family pseudouridine synthase [Verrucomicrobiaceae bacterium]|nr:RluA family pseudouridine synthase [Verrucomicrobiaceae bacterium]
MQFDVTANDGAGDRLDRFLQKHVAELSRARLQDLIKSGHALLNTRPTKPSAELKAGDTISLSVPEPQQTAVEAQDIPLNILYEDSDIVVLNKDSGIVVHPAAGNPDGTLVNALLHHCDDLSGIGGELRPGIVHRLDKETSGCMVVAKHDRAHVCLTDAFAGRRIKKIYLAAVNGMPNDRAGRIENMIGRHPVDRKRMAVLFDGSGKNAITEWKVVGEHNGCALVLCHLFTGRTHQIRVHMRDVLQRPILGDGLYGHPSRQLIKCHRLMLHAWKLAFDHPISQKAMSFEAPIPDEFMPWTQNLYD